MANTGKKGLITFDAKDPASKFHRRELDRRIQTIF